MNPDRRREDERLNQLYEDMYIGRDADNPPVTLRLDRLEGWMQQTKEDFKEAKDNAKWTKRLIIATLVTALVNIILHVMGK